ncbi:MAG: hypothetical protein ACUVRM_01765 [Bacillota bacterium]
MAFEPQNNLERFLMRAAVDPAYHPQFYRDFVESDIFIIEYGPPPARAGRKVLENIFELFRESQGPRLDEGVDPAFDPNGRVPLSPLFFKAHEVITQARLASGKSWV